MTDYEKIINFPITTKSRKSCINEILLWIKNCEKGKYMVCANPHSLVLAKKDTIFAETLMNADLVIPDGIGIVIASKILGGIIKERITGNDIFWYLNRSLNTYRKYSCFFLGSTDENLNKINVIMRKEFPGIKVIGKYAPPIKEEFSENDNSVMIKAVNEVQPDVLWIGMTAPKQEKWIYQHRKQLNVKFIGPIGAVFDFLTGKVKRSHPWLQKNGMEWLPRLIQEPKRLWKRTFISAPLFLVHILLNDLLNKIN